MGKTRSHTGSLEEREKRSDFRRTLSQEQIFELQDAITEFFNSEKEKMQLEKKLFKDEETLGINIGALGNDDMDQADWEEEEKTERI